jgi:Putative metallopeptidase
MNSRGKKTVITHRIGVCALSGLLLLSGSVFAQPNVRQVEHVKKFEEGSAQFRARLDQAIRDIDADPRLKDLTQQQRKRLIEFVTGNLLFGLLHEIGHAIIVEMNLPVLGRMEDAADSYAIVAMLDVGTDVSRDVLVDAARGWFLSAERNQKEGLPPRFYGEHGIDQQRAYEIVCLMVGSDPNRFAELANRVEMPKERQGSCSVDYDNASWSWTTALKSHLRSPEQPKQQIKVTYGPAGDYAPIAKMIRTIGLTEVVANYLAVRYVWPRPITFDLKSCDGQPNLQWDPEPGKIVLCYEMALYFADLYRDYGLSGDAPKAESHEKQ